MLKNRSEYAAESGKHSWLQYRFSPAGGSAEACRRTRHFEEEDRYAFDVWKGLVGDKPSQLKHWFFKWSINRLEIRRGEVTIEITPSEDKYEEIGKLIGVALFELGDNIAKDYNSYLEIVNRPFQFNILLPASLEVGVNLSELEQCYKNIADPSVYRSIRSSSHPAEGELLSVVQDLEERFKKETSRQGDQGCVENKSSGPGSLDLLAHTLYMKRGYSVVIEKLKRINCVRRLLQQFHYD